MSESDLDLILIYIGIMAQYEVFPIRYIIELLNKQSRIVLTGKLSIHVHLVILLPHAHVQGVKQSVLSVCCLLSVFCRHHENRQISSSRHLCVL